MQQADGQKEQRRSQDCSQRDVIFMTGLIISSAVSWRKKYSSLKMESTPPKQTNNKPGQGREASEVGGRSLQNDGS